MAATVATGTSGLVWASRLRGRRRELQRDKQPCTPLRLYSSSLFSPPLSYSILPKQRSQAHNAFVAVACLPSSPKSTAPSTKLYVSGLSFRTTEENLINAFKNFGSLVEVNLVMDRIANRPRGFAFLRYATEDESKKAIEGMHGKPLGMPRRVPEERRRWLSFNKIPTFHEFELSPRIRQSERFNSM
ncbi:hypothetical protein RJ640_027905 [Escallonia rubra]|uniref:RRM domain-containing protein n=1 Tax=Escallonia rubra TaxID=112253 RepID=A0AA88QPU9_9ASTE|nr:hypothetical protein RJ640_027905 [Escallonia rubra]